MLTIRPINAADVPLALRLSTQAGWNQIAADWQRLVDLWPDTCLAGWLDGQLIATATLATYANALGWLGMVLVDETHRGRGYGGAIFDAVIHAATQRGIAQLALDASDQGRPVYLKRGFIDVAPITRWTGNARRRTNPSPRDVIIQPAQSDDWPDMLAADLAACGVDRSGLLRQLACEPGALVQVALRNQQLAGFAFARPGRTASFLGPVWAADGDMAADIVLSVLDQLAQADGAQPVLLDLPGESWLSPMLSQQDFRPQRRLTRMARALKRPAGSTLCSRHLPAAAGFELG